MACVILPSETARLVYGYLVKENLNEIASQFLESSPYLTDCCQIVKSGYQFNTKLMGKDLKEMLQEYSVIHNLVNNKVNLLCKTSLLYKKIKLGCESLPEILELILFWRSKNSKNEENLIGNFKSDKYTNSQTVNCEYNVSSELKNISEVTTSKINNLSASENNSFNENNEADSSQNIDESVSDNFQSKLNCETCPTNKDSQESSESNQIQENQVNGFQEDGVREKASPSINQNQTLFPSTKINEIPNESESNSSSNNNNTNNKNNPSTGLTSSTVTNNNNNTNVLNLDMNPPQNEDLPTNDINVSGILESNEGAIGFDSQIKIVRIEKENQTENGTLGIFPKPVVDTGGNVEVESSSVVYVAPEVGNVTINQDRNQIIVIPIDYYKSQNELEGNGGVDNNQKSSLVQEKEVTAQEKNEVIFEGLSAPEAYAAAVTQLYTDSYTKSRGADENIMTESDFLKNGHLMQNLVEKELKKSIKQPPPPPQPQPLTYQEPVAAPLIVLSQAIVPEQNSRYRTILPKESKPFKVQPLFTVHPLLEKNKVTRTNNFARRRPIKGETKSRNCRKQLKKKTLVQKDEIKEPENSESFNMPTIKTPAHDEMGGTNPAQSTMETVQVEEPQKAVDIERTNEEKENLEKAQTKKTETPIFVTKRSLKRQSLSTPRRRSHIRALDFETPPKTNEEKKSRTSPKVKVDQVAVVERKSVRNTLFKSPIPETSFKSPNPVNGDKKSEASTALSKSETGVEPLSELSIPIATRSPNTKLSDAWEKLTGVGCVIGQNEAPVTNPTTKKMWDADLRHFISGSNEETETVEKKRIRKPERNQKDTRKATKKKNVSTKKLKTTPITVSPSKMSLTAKRNTYSINGNEEGSPLRSLLDDLKIVTPFKDIETIRPTEETPLTKLLRENINTIDIDLSMINTPSFPPTPSIVITPDLDDVSAMAGTNYYSPTKDCTKDKVLKITDYFRVDTEKASKQETREMHEKVIGDLVSKAKEIIGIGRENQEENATKGPRPSGKILSMVKIQMLTQCDKKLCENIPINEESNFANSFSNQTSLIGSLSEETTKSDLKGELEEKKKRALSKIKVVKENLNNSTKPRGIKRKRTRKRSGNSSRTDKSKSDVSSENLIIERQNSESEESPRKPTGILHSTPYPADKKPCPSFEKSDSGIKVDNKILDDIRQEFPPFEDNADRYPGLTEKSRKKLHYVENFLKLSEIVKFLSDYNDRNPPKLFLKSSLRRFFQVFYKWLRHPHKRELNSSPETKVILEEYLCVFDKINKGLNQRNKRFKKDKAASDGAKTLSGAGGSDCFTGNKCNLSDDDEREWKGKGGNERRKDEETEDGIVSTLPLKKRKSTVQQVDSKNATASTSTEKEESKASRSESVSQTQNFLQDIDVDRFLSQIHGQENR